MLTDYQILLQKHWRPTPDNNLLLSKSYGVPPSEIIPGLWIGNFYDAINPELLSGLHFQSVISVAGDLPTKLQNMIYSIYVLNQPFGDTANLAEYAVDMIQKIRIAGFGQTLVNCWEGVDRSTTIVWKFLVKHQRMVEDEAMKLIKEKRPIANPHPDWFCIIDQS